MKNEQDRKWTSADRQKVSSSKSQQAFQRFREANADLFKPKSNEGQRKEKQNGN